MPYFFCDFLREWHYIVGIKIEIYSLFVDFCTVVVEMDRIIA